MKKKSKVREKAPNFTAKNPKGEKITLNKILGKVTVIDFWASWCGPCRQENPTMVAIYKAYHKKGLTMIGVSLDNDPEKWIQAITKDNLNWYQVSNLKQWQDPIAKNYGIESIPSTIILDEQGYIVAKNLFGDELKETLDKMLP